MTPDIAYFRPLLDSDQFRDRFWSQVSNVFGGGCWAWFGNRHPKGHARIFLRLPGVVLNTFAPRVAYFMCIGDIPDGMCVLHKCDNQACCRPDHLFLGTHLDNIADMVAKGRQSKADSQPGAKITCKQADEIRRRYAAGGLSQNSLAEEYGVCQPRISRIVHKGGRH